MVGQDPVEVVYNVTPTIGCGGEDPVEVVYNVMPTSVCGGEDPVELMCNPSSVTNTATVSKTSCYETDVRPSHGSSDPAHMQTVTKEPCKSNTQCAICSVVDPGSYRGHAPPPPDPVNISYKKMTA